VSVPTEKQYTLLRALGSPNTMLVIGTRRDVAPLLRRGWVTAEDREKHYAWVRITAAGCRALADAIDRYGLPEFKHAGSDA
jgi:hypothetical protein